MNKKQLQSEETKHRIVEVASELFAKKGYNAASIVEMAAAAQCSKANIYYHFKSKEGLFLHIAELLETEWYRNWEVHKTSYDTVTDQLFGVIEFSTKQGLAHPLYMAACEFIEGHAEESSMVRKLLAAKIEKNRLFYEGLMTEGIVNGEFKPGNARQYGIILEGMVRGINETAGSMDPMETLELYKAALHVLLHGIVREH